MKNLAIVSSLIVFLFICLFGLPTTASAQDGLTRGMKAFSKGQYDKAQVVLESAVAENPDDFRNTYWLAQTYKANGLYSEAQDYYEETLRLKPDFPAQIYIDLADVSVANEDYKKAVRYIKKANDKGYDSPMAQQIKGVALMKMEDHDDAFEIFESLSQGDSNLKDEASFYAGLTSQEMRNLDVAEQYFQNVIAANAQSDLGDLAQQQIEFQSFFPPMGDVKDLFTLQTGLSMQLDTNPTLRSRNQGFAQTNNIRGERDQSMVFTANAQWNPRLNGPVNLTGNYFLYMDGHAEFEAQDVMSHTLVLTPSIERGGLSYSLPTSVNYTEVNRDAYVREYSVSPTISYPYGDEYLFQGSVNFAHQAFARTPTSAAENRDNNNYGLGLSAFKFFNGSDGYWNVRFDIDDSSADGQNWDRREYKLSSLINYPITDKITGFGSASYEFSNYDNNHTTLGVKRQDEEYVLSIGASYKLADDLVINARNTMQRNASNMTLYDYKRNITNVGIQKSWGF